MIASFSGRKDADTYGLFEASFKTIDDNKGTGSLNTPDNSISDLVTMFFENKNGIEYCHTSSYIYRDVETLQIYNGQTFHQDKNVNMVYKINSELKELPEVANGRRILILCKDLSVEYDTLYGGDYKSVKVGYISFV